MADDVTVDNGGLTDYTVATDDVGGRQFQVVKIDLGGDGTSTPVEDSLPVNDDTAAGILADIQTAAAAIQTAVEGTLAVDGSGATQPVSGSVTANAGTNLNTSALALETGGNLASTATSLAAIDDWDESDRAKVNVIVGQAGIDGNSGNKSAATPRVVLATDQPQLTNALKVDGSAVTQPVSVASLPSQAVTNAGTFAVQIDGSALTALQLIDDPVFADDGTFTPGTSKVTAIGQMADETSTDSVDEGDVGIPRMTLDRKSIVANHPHTQGGLLVAKNLDIDESEDAVKTGRGQVYGWWLYNAHATAVRYVKFYNDTVANVVVGSTAPKMTLALPPLSAANVAFTVGIEFDTAITIAATTGIADNDSGAPGANEVSGDIFYF